MVKGPDFNSMRDIDNDRSQELQQMPMVSEAETRIVTQGGDEKDYTVTVEGRAANCLYTSRYTLYPDGVVDLQVVFSPTGPTRRLGLGMELAGFDQVAYYGRGPWSNYVDRMTGSYLGRYTTTVDEMIDENVHPQTFGDHQDLRDLILDHANGLRLSVVTRVGWPSRSPTTTSDSGATLRTSFGAMRPIGTTWCAARRSLPTSTPSSAAWAITLVAATVASTRISVPPADSSPIRCASRPPCVSRAQLFFIGRAFSFARSLSHPPPSQCFGWWGMSGI